MTEIISPENYVMPFGKYKQTRAIDVAELYQVDKMEMISLSGCSTCVDWYFRIGSNTKISFLKLLKQVNPVCQTSRKKNQRKKRKRRRRKTIKKKKTKEKQTHS